MRERGQTGERRRHRPYRKSPAMPDEGRGHPGQPDGHDRRDGQRNLRPGPAARRLPPWRLPSWRTASRSAVPQLHGGAHAAHDDHRRHAGDQDEAVGELAPGQQDGHGGRHVPAGPPGLAAGQQVHGQPGQQHGHGAAEVIGAHQQRGAHARCRRQHDDRRDQRPDKAFPAGGAALGEPGGEQEDQRVRHCPGDVDHLGAEPPHRLDQGVLDQFGRVERHIRHGPVAQQHIAVQHVPGLQRDRPAVRAGGTRSDRRR